MERGGCVVREDGRGCLVMEDGRGCLVREDGRGCLVREDGSEWTDDDWDRDDDDTEYNEDTDIGCNDDRDSFGREGICSERGSSEYEEIDLGCDDTLAPPYCFNTESGSVADDTLFAMGLKMRLRSFGGKTLPTA